MDGVEKVSKDVCNSCVSETPNQKFDRLLSEINSYKKGMKGFRERVAEKVVKQKD